MGGHQYATSKAKIDREENGKQKSSFYAFISFLLLLWWVFANNAIRVHQCIDLSAASLAAAAPACVASEEDNQIKWNDGLFCCCLCCCTVQLLICWRGLIDARFSRFSVG
jgi:hypothetical protein